MVSLIQEYAAIAAQASRNLLLLPRQDNEMDSSETIMRVFLLDAFFDEAIGGGHNPHVGGWKISRSRGNDRCLAARRATVWIGL